MLQSRDVAKNEESSGAPVPIDAGEITHLLVAWSKGDLEALDRVLPLAFADLRRIARKCHRNNPSKELQPTELIGEIYKVLLEQETVSWQGRGQFYKFAAFLMERYLLENKRRFKALKRGGGATDIALVDNLELAVTDDASSLSFGGPTSEAKSGAADTLATLGVAIDIADKLAELAELDPLQAEVVRLRYIIGLTREETAKELGVSVKTVARKWINAKRFLARELGDYPRKDDSSDP